MFARAFVTIVIAGFAIGMLIPTPEKEAAVIEAPKAAELKTTPKSAPVATHSDGSARSSVDVVLKRRPNGHFYADVEINGQLIEFMVDTGATGIALTGEDARRLGFDWHDFDLQPVGRGVSGEVSGKMVELHHVRLGGKEAWDMQAAIIPEGLDVSLLGQSFLSQIGSVKISNDEMVLR